MSERARFQADLDALRQALTGRDDTERAEAASEPSPAGHGLDQLLSELKGSDLESLGQDAVAEIQKLQKDHPITSLAAAFALGYLLGRAR